MNWKEIWTHWVNTYTQHRMTFVEWLTRYYEAPKRNDKKA